MRLLKGFGSLQSKLLVSILTICFLSLALLTGFLVYSYDKIQKSQVSDWIESDARANASVVQEQLNAIMAEARTYARASLDLRSQPDAVRAKLLSELARSALQTKGVSASYFMFDRDNYFTTDMGANPEQVYSYSWYKGPDGKPMEDGIGPYDVAPDDDFFWLAYRSGMEVIVEPYRWLYEGASDSALMTSLVAPIRDGNKTIGIFGFDILLDDLYKIYLSPIKPAGEGYTVMVSNKGIRAGHRKPELLMKPMGDDIPPEKQKELHRDIAAGKTRTVEKTSMSTGQISRFRFHPITVGNSTTPWSLASVYMLDYILEESQNAQRKSYLIALLVLLLLSLMIWWIGGEIVKPIRKTAVAMENISRGEGDLTARIRVDTNDELAALAQGFNRFAEKMQDMVRDVKSGVHTIASSAEELDATAMQTSSLAEEMNAQAQGIVSAAEQTTVNSGQISHATGVLSESMQSVAGSVRKMKLSLQEVSISCEKEFKEAANAKQQAEGVRKTMDRLGAVASEVEKVLDLIGDIAEQTNLLALNATIEAATAGDAGKGFAVVAGEVKELAKQTAGATGQIAAQMESMRRALRESMESIAGISKTIESVNDISGNIISAVEEQALIISSIAQTVDNASLEATQISRSVQEIAQGMQGVTKNMNTLGQATQEAARSSLSIQESSRNLSALGASQLSLVDQFKV